MVLFKMVTEEILLVKDLNTKHGYQCLVPSIMLKDVHNVRIHYSIAREAEKGGPLAICKLDSEDSAPLPLKIREIASEK